MLITLFVLFSFTAWGAKIPAYYMVSGVDGNAEQIKAEPNNALKSNGFIVLGDYNYFSTTKNRSSAPSPCSCTK